MFLTPQTVDFYLDVPDIVGVDYDLYLRRVADNGTKTLVAQSIGIYQVDEHISYLVTETTAGKYELQVRCWTNVGPPLESAYLSAFYATYDDYDYRLEYYPHNNPSAGTTLHIPSTYAPTKSVTYQIDTPGTVIDLVFENLNQQGWHYAYADLEYQPTFQYHTCPTQTSHNFGPGIGTIPCKLYPQDFQWEDGIALSSYGDAYTSQDMGCSNYEIDSSSVLYNCHAYAWTDCDQYWIDDPNQMINNLIDCDEVIPMDDIYEDNHYANYVCFSQTANGPYNHSGKIINQAQSFNTAWIRSKIGLYVIADLLGSNATTEWTNRYGTYKHYFRRVSNPIDDEIISSTVGLNGNYPNPFNASTTIKYVLPKTDQHYEIEIYNIKGQKIKTVELEQKSGENTIFWDGTTEKGLMAASGVYFYRLISNKQVIDTKKMILIK